MESLTTALEAIQHGDPLSAEPSELLGEAKESLKQARDEGDLHAGIPAMQLILEPQIMLQQDGTSRINEAFAQALGWYFYKLISPYFDQPNKLEAWLPELKAIFMKLPNLPYSKPDVLHSCLLRTLLDRLPLTDESRYALLIQQRFESLTEDDFEPFGEYEVIFAEKLFNFLLKQTVAIAKESPDQVDIDDWLERAHHWEDKLPNAKFLVYHRVFLMHYAGATPEELYPQLRRFLQKGLKDGWRWAKTAEVFAGIEERNRAIQCYIRAISLTKKDKSALKWRWQVLRLLKQRGFLDLGHKEAEAIANVHEKHQEAYKTWQQALLDDIQQTPQNKKIKEFYRRALEAADDFLFEDLPQKQGIVTRVQEKGYTLTLSGDQDAFLPANRVGGKLQELDFIQAYVAENTQKPGKLMLHGTRKIDPPDDTDLLKELEGNLKLKGENSFGFVHGVFVPSQLLQEQIFTDGEPVRVLAVRQYDRKKKRWGYAAKQIGKLSFAADSLAGED